MPRLRGWRENLPGSLAEAFTVTSGRGSVARPTYRRLADLPLRVSGYGLAGCAMAVSSGWVRETTVIRLHGAGHVGEGEDVWTSADDQRRFQAHGPVLDLSGTWTIATFSDHLGTVGIFPDATSATAVNFRRWGFESAALDLALRQAGISLAEALGRVPAPVSWVLSLRLAVPGEASDVAPIASRLAVYPDLRFKLDAVADWDETLIHRLLEIAPGKVAALDFKAHYHGTSVDTLPDPALYARCLAAWPTAIIEDPSDDPSVVPVLEGNWDRVSWDAPIHRVDDIVALAHPPRILNIKPCRFGSLRALCAAYDYCDEHGIAMYGGGYFELGPGRGQIQYLASLFHPGGTNDVSPRAFHGDVPVPGLPGSPLPVAAAPQGFAWADHGGRA
jgi:L-alanine-DL-glutamate epimerase-like enolase superfamily enzyme